MDPVTEISGQLEKAQENIKALKKLVVGWTNKPLFERRDGRKDQLLCLDDIAKERKEKRYKEIRETSVKLKELIDKNKEILYNESTTNQMWNDYLAYVDDFVVEGLVKTIAVS